MSQALTQAISQALAQARMLLTRARLLARPFMLRADVWIHNHAQWLHAMLFRTRQRTVVTALVTLALLVALTVTSVQVVARWTPPMAQPASAALVGKLPGATLWHSHASSLLF
ncbi:MAG: hypothetical protein ABI068_03920, partial [Ktedonobacterales bacterium]